MELLLFIAAVALFFGVIPACDRWEQRRDQADREWFAEWFGGRR